MTTEQKYYSVAKAYVSLLRDEQEAAEQEYIKVKGIVNEDGTTPFALYCIDDQKIFDKANEEFSELEESKKLWAEIVKAEEVLKNAEETLIEFGLNVIPESMKAVKEALTNSYKKNYTVRLNLIDLAFRYEGGR